MIACSFYWPASIRIWCLCALSMHWGTMAVTSYTTPDSCDTKEYFLATNLSCAHCGANQVSSSDRLSCTCPPSYRLVNPTGLCEPCLAQQVTSEDGLYCLTCLLNSTCSNPEGLASCRITSWKYIYVDEFNGPNGTRSCQQCPPGTWADTSQRWCVACSTEDCNVTACTSGGNLTACQLSVNLCALNDYSAMDPSCLLLSSIYGDIVPNSLDKALIITQLSTKADSTLPLVVLTYAIDGSFTGIKNLTDDILLCKDLPSRTSSAWTVGTIYGIECTVSFDTPASPLMELYFRDQANVLHPIPVVISNYKDKSGSFVNQGSDSSTWQYVRRFYLWTSNKSKFSYAQSVELRFTISSDSKLYPYLRIVYNSTYNQKTSFSIIYTTQNDNQFNIGLAIGAAILIGLSTVYSAIITNGYLRRTGKNFCEIPVLVYLGVELCSAISVVLFILLFTSSVFWLVLYKAQTTLYFVLPLGSQELGLKILIAVVFVSRLVHVVYLLVQQCSVDIFFIDWERPKGSAPLPETTHMATPTPAAQPVSVWRILFVANEWNKLQAVRKINPMLLLVITLLFLKVIGFEYLAEQEPYSHVTQSPDRYSPPYSSTLRFSLTSLHFMIIAAIMRIYTFAIHERYFKHKVKDFVDLCSVSNVSVLVLSAKLYGHYIHGRSVHGHAETSMREMAHNLSKEEEDLCGRRGLVADTDIQTFEISLTRHFRSRYDNILLPLMAENAAAPARTDANRADGGGGANRVNGGGISEVCLRTHENMNHFLALFVERNLSEVDYVIKDKLFIEKILGVELTDPVDRCLFYNDPGISFDSVLFYGNEWPLLQFDMMLFAAVDLVAQNYILAAIVSCIASLTITQLRRAFGEKNLSKKAVIDRRFLL